VNSTLALSQHISGPGISSAETNQKPFNIFFHQQLNTSGFSNILTEEKPVTTLNATQGLNNPLLSSNDANFEQFNHDAERNNNSKPLFVNHTAQTHNDNEEPLVDLALTLLNELNEQQEWVNHLDHELRYECPTGHFISGMKSFHKNRQEDRRWSYNCLPQPFKDEESQTCKWSRFLNDFDQKLHYSCREMEGTSYIAGFHSYHSNHHEDRRWRVKCCGDSGSCVSECRRSDWLNDYDGPLDYSIPENHVASGLESIHSNWYEDRKWRFQICKLTKC